MNADRLRGAAARIAADLRARRMLPVIVLLILAIVAIPIVLGHSAATAGSTTPVAIAPASTTAQTSITAETTTGAAGSHAAHHARETASGSSHDPFVQPPTPTQSTGSSSASSGNAAGVTDLAVTTNSSTAHAAASSPASSTASTGTHDAGTTSTATTTTTTQTTTTSTPATTGAYSAYRVGISFGSASGGARPYRNLPRDAVLQSGGTPLLIFLGVARDGVSGVFFLASGVTPAGEGNCSPSRVKCQFLILKPHDYVVLIDHAASGAVSVDTLTFGAPERVTSATPIVRRISALGARTIAWAAISVPQLRAMSYDPTSGLLHTGKLKQVAAGAAAIPQAVAATLTPIG